MLSLKAVQNYHCTITLTQQVTVNYLKSLHSQR